MIKKKILILSMVAIMLNVPMKSYSYSLNNIQLATSSSNGSSSGGGETNSPPSQTPSGGSNGQNNPLDNKGGSNSVELDGGIGEWGLDKDDSLPDFDKPESGDKPDVDNEPEKDEYFTISATVPLNMEFLIKNKYEDGFSREGIFITPYYKVVNNGSHTLKVHFESFEYATSKTTKTSGLVKEELGKLYVVETPEAENGRVEMTLDLMYDRPSNPYFKKIKLIPPENSSTITSKLLKSTNQTEEVLGLLDPNEEGRLYYGSDLWETPKSEGIEKGVEANFNLKLAFSINGKTTETNPPTGTPDSTPSPSSGEVEGGQQEQTN